MDNLRISIKNFITQNKAIILLILSIIHTAIDYGTASLDGGSKVPIF